MLVILDNNATAPTLESRKQQEEWEWQFPETINGQDRAVASAAACYKKQFKQSDKDSAFATKRDRRDKNWIVCDCVWENTAIPAKLDSRRTCGLNQMVPLKSGNPESRSWIKPNFTSRAFSPLRGSSTLGETAGGFTSRSGPSDQDAADLLENYNGEVDKKCFPMTALLYSVLISLSSLKVSWEEDRLAGRKIQWQQQPQVWTCSLFFYQR